MDSCASKNSDRRWICETNCRLWIFRKAWPAFRYTHVESVIPLVIQYDPEVIIPLGTSGQEEVGRGGCKRFCGRCRYIRRNFVAKITTVDYRWWWLVCKGRVRERIRNFHKINAHFARVHPSFFNSSPFSSEFPAINDGVTEFQAGTTNAMEREPLPPL